MYLKSFFLKIFFVPFTIILLIMLPDMLFAMANKHYLFVTNFTEVKKLFLFVLFFTFLKYRYKVVALSFFYLFIYLSLASFNYFGQLSTPYDILLFFTHSGEVLAGLKDESWALGVPFLISIFSFVLALFWIKKVDKYTLQFPYSSLIFVVMLSILPYRIYKDVYILNIDSVMKYPQTTSTSLRNSYKAMNYFFLVTLPKSLAEHKHTILSDDKVAEIKTRSVQANIILILGESFRSKSASFINKNALKNMPKLSRFSQEKTIYAKNALAAGTMTKVSISYLLHQVDSIEHIPRLYGSKFSLFKQAKDNNLSTHFITHQSASDSRYLIPMISAQHIDDIQTPVEILHTDNLGATVDDGNIIKSLNLVNLTKPNFIVLQMQGSHTPYSTKSPKAFKTFESEYENSIEYTDSVLGGLISYLESKKKSILPTYILFVSDHGEMLGERGMYGHGHLEEEVFKVPFFYYSTEENNSMKNFIEDSMLLTHFDISQMLLSLMGYDISLQVQNHRHALIMGKDVDGYNGYLDVMIENKDINISKIKSR